MTEHKAKKNSNSVNISLNPEALGELLAYKEALGKKTGLNPTYSQVILYLINHKGK